MLDQRRFEGMLAAERGAGELRVNLLRLLAIVAFYGNHLVDLLQRGLTDRATLHEGIAVAVVVALWGSLVAHVVVAMRLGRAGPSLPYRVVALDLLFASLLVTMLDGPASSLVMLYPVIVASTALRLSVPLVRFGTLGAVASYVIVVALRGLEGVVPRLRGIGSGDLPGTAAFVIVVLSITVVGLLAGQGVRQALRMAVRGLDAPSSSGGPSEAPNGPGAGDDDVTGSGNGDASTVEEAR
ncbi:MAG TPA: hypothetical protein DCQ98_10900 [Planctomycetaceae bacterium]|nr:hypothetical protein [Planctomycetaceae bacterium]HRF01113.1 hypothetical protein [Pirellulaceae bacterium]